MTSDPNAAPDDVVERAFGAKNRARLIDHYFTERGAPSASDAWQHVYRLLLWVDLTTGLAHCYESDKCQPGKNWYGRSLAFHDWLACSLDKDPMGVVDEIDWLFDRATRDLAASVLRRADSLLKTAAKQRKGYESRGMPRPGEDPALVAIVRDALGSHLRDDVPSETWQALVQRIRQHLALENKRRNLVGEGFEDVVASVIRRVVSRAGLQVHARHPLSELPGFANSRTGAKKNKVDLALLRDNGRKRTLVTVKWSVRADRERQFNSDYADYIDAKSDLLPFEYVFVTNEFDPARLKRACEQTAGHSYMFAHVVHINPAALRATYGASPEESMEQVLAHIDGGRLISLKQWLERLAGSA